LFYLKIIYFKKLFESFILGLKSLKYLYKIVKNQSLYLKYYSKIIFLYLIERNLNNNLSFNNLLVELIKFLKRNFKLFILIIIFLYKIIFFLV